MSFQQVNLSVLKHVIVIDVIFLLNKMYGSVMLFIFRYMFGNAGWLSPPETIENDTYNKKNLFTCL